jgi:S1-C subfamily serine protease
MLPRFQKITPFVVFCSGSIIASLLGAVVPLASHAQQASDANGLTNSVVKVFATSRLPDPFKPWAKQGPRDGTGSGVVIEGNRILTNAHVVSYANQVEIQGNGSGDKLTATVVAISPGIDLAVLKLDDESFFKTHPPMARANTLPEIKDAVLAYGFPTGGSSLSITKGIVSRIEYASYSAATSGLRVQIDAAINPGNSGGPAVAGDKMIGLAFSRLVEAQNIGYIIPNEEVELFLKDIADGQYDGKYFMLDEVQKLENPALRKFLKLDSSVKGLIVHKPHKDDASYPLKKWDIITHVGEAAVDDQGMVKVGTDLRLNMRYWVQKTASNGEVALTVRRDGKSLNIKLPVVTTSPQLIPDLNGAYPPYFVYGPLVFSKATTAFTAFLANNPSAVASYSIIRSPLVTRRSDPPTADLEELVVVSSPYFPHRLSTGYASATGSVILAINGTKVRSLSHLVTLLRDNKEDFVTIESDNKGGETLVFPHKDMLAAMEDILTDNGVRSQGSPELMDVWQGKKKVIAAN